MIFILLFLIALFTVPVFTLLLAGTLTVIFVAAWVYCGIQQLRRRK